MLHAAGGAGFPAESLLRGLISDKSLAQNLQGDGTVDEQMRRAIHGAHAATTQGLVEPVLPIENATQKRIERDVGHGSVGLERRLIERTHKHIVRILLTTSQALKHKLIGQEERTSLSRKKRGEP
jgi:hypothetical protein